MVYKSVMIYGYDIWLITYKKVEMFLHLFLSLYGSMLSKNVVSSSFIYQNIMPNKQFYSVICKKIIINGLKNKSSFIIKRFNLHQFNLHQFNFDPNYHNYLL